MKLRAICVALVAATGAPGCGDENANPDGGTVVPAGSTLVVTNLVGSQAGAVHQDPMLINAWGMAFGPTGVAWVAANGTGTTRLYDANGVAVAQLPQVTIPAPAGATGPSAPTGQVFNGDAAVFHGDAFILCTEDGTIAGWKPANAGTAVLEVDRSADANPPVYKGLAMATNNGATRLYVADFANNRIDIYDSNFQLVTLSNAFVDPNMPAGFAPFNVYAVGTKIYVSYAKQKADTHDDEAGLGNGFIDTFDTDGGSQARLVSQGVLDSPWGMVIAPGDFGAASNMLIVGNFGDGRMHIYNPSSGALVTPMFNTLGQPLVIDGLWALAFGNGAGGTSTSTMYFTAGPVEESQGLFGTLTVANTSQQASATP